jgi:hypothetical protein
VTTCFDRAWSFSGHNVDVMYKWEKNTNARVQALYRVRHKSVNTPLSHERLVVRTWLAVYSGWG